MGLDVQTFHLLLESGYRESWETHHIPWVDAPSHGQPWLQAHSLNAAGSLGLLLHYLTSAILETTLQQIFALIPTTVSRYIHFGLRILFNTLCTIPDAAIWWPEEQEFEELNKLISQRHPLLREDRCGAFCSMDRLKLAVQVSDDPDIETRHTMDGYMVTLSVAYLCYLPKVRNKILCHG